MSNYKVLKNVWLINQGVMVRPGGQVAIDNDYMAAILLSKGCLAPAERRLVIEEEDQDGCDVCCPSE